MPRSRPRARRAGLHGHVDAFLRELAATRGASQHTLRAYGRDLDELLVFLAERDVEPRHEKGLPQ